MITDTTKHKCEISDFTQTTKFGINESDFSHIASLLEDKTYSNKLIFVQELSTNAHDAHVEIGKPDLSFDITFPTTWEPYFKIRDYGPGLSEEDVRTVYTKYGASTKRHSNLFNGHLGIGSKSPFAYTKTFTITSYFGGQKTTYIAYKNELRESCLSTAHSEPSDEPNGLELTIPINKEDVERVISFAGKVYTYFTPRPNVLNLDSSAHHTYIYSLKSEDESEVLLEGILDVDDDPVTYKVYKRYLHKGVQIVMGNVTYKINNSYWQDTKYSAFLNNCDMVFFVPIGSVSNAADRESLEYTDKTVKYITAILEELSENVLKDYNSQLEKATTLWEARHIIRHIKTQKLVYIYDIVSDNLIWKGQKIPGYELTRSEVQDINIYRLKHASDNNNKRIVLRDFISASVTTTPIIIDRQKNLKRDTQAKLLAAYNVYREQLYNDGYLYNDQHPLVIQLPKGAKQEELNKIKAHPSLVGAEFVYLETIEGSVDTDTAITDNSKTTSDIFTLVKGFYRKSSDYWRIATNTSAPAPVPYVVIDRYNVQSISLCTYELLTLQEELEQDFPGLLPNGVIYGIKQRAVGALDLDKYCRFEKWVDGALIEYFKTNNLLDQYKRTCEINWGKYHDTDWPKIFSNEVIIEYSYKNGVFKDAVTAYRKSVEVKEAKTLPTKLIKYIPNLLASLNTTKTTINMETHIDNIKETYPLLNCLLYNLSYSWSSNYKENTLSTLEYIALKDAQTQNV